jgi:hypothetical protein
MSVIIYFKGKNRSDQIEEKDVDEIHKNRSSIGCIQQISLFDISFVKITHTHILYIKTNNSSSYK